jgi:hypothetical protein
MLQYEHIKPVLLTSQAQFDKYLLESKRFQKNYLEKIQKKKNLTNKLFSQSVAVFDSIKRKGTYPPYL